MIQVENLTKYYGKRLAVDNISFNVGKGGIVGFLGPNWVGKTTAMRILTRFLAPTQKMSLEDIFLRLTTEEKISK